MSDFQDPLRIFSKSRDQHHAFRDMLPGISAFLLCGGPSTKSLDLQKLNQRGVWSMSVNNVGGSVRTNAFVCSDPPSKFHHGIWLDPCVMKFVPAPKLSPKRGYLREKVGSSFSTLHRNGVDISTMQCPNVHGFSRRSWWSHDDTFFTDGDATWGNLNDGVMRTNNPKTVCTMLLAMRIMYYLGVRTIYLLGVDFSMSTNAGYSFDQSRTPEASNSNNNQYSIVNDGLCAMKSNGVFDRFGLKLYNCNQMSQLRAFEYVPYEVALDEVLTGFPKEPFDLAGWYEK